MNKKNKIEENISQEFRLNNIDETRNYFNRETNKNDLMSKKYKTACRASNYIGHLLILASVVTGCISNSAFASLDEISIGIQLL